MHAGLAADVTIFAADKIIDRSTYPEPFQYSEGIEYVIVNGQLVLVAVSEGMAFGAALQVRKGHTPHCEIIRPYPNSTSLRLRCGWEVRVEHRDG